LGIENRSHYVRDVSFFEDLSRIRIKAGHSARCCSFALNVLRANGTTNIRRELYINALNSDNALSYWLAQGELNSPPTYPIQAITSPWLE
jgi:hypothetical protein